MESTWAAPIPSEEETKLRSEGASTLPSGEGAKMSLAEVSPTPGLLSAHWLASPGPRMGLGAMTEEEEASNRGPGLGVLVSKPGRESLAE